ncbi:glycoprotein-N-acetylgalactosamine 3-beta-galactosyltransferase 1-like isoform X2 [Plodia interpunctella]|nr:glycoprotein-N-acetylgalactosamine 3-beta-galactosyltransferase 1-like isoform X2 [Plodia interpunctella]XP_053614049.1 glycoprotein-N-acetylgalactosamine 3-beta-galactosyltransferase 1-like isoform X2 [Plodia interpunctella]
MADDEEWKNLEELFYPTRRHLNSLKENVSFQFDISKDSLQIGSENTISIKEKLLWKEENRTVADDMRTRVSVLCWIMTLPQNHMTKAIHVKETWGKRYDKLLFMSTKYDNRLPTVNLGSKENKSLIWGKTQEALMYIYKNYLNQAEWFLKADDETYVIVENLKYMLNDYNTNDPIYFGFRIKLNPAKDEFFNGRASYVLSREALTLLVSTGLIPRLCSTSPLGYTEIKDLTNCLEKLGVILMDTRDKYKTGRFFPFLPNQHINAETNKNVWFWIYNYYPFSAGRDCCSEFAISFHQIDSHMMYAMEYFTYHLRPYGISYEYYQMYN